MAGDTEIAMKDLEARYLLEEMAEKDNELLLGGGNECEFERE